MLPVLFSMMRHVIIQFNIIQYYAANIKGDELKSPPRPKPVTPKQQRRKVMTPTSPPRFPSDISEYDDE